MFKLALFLHSLTLAMTVSAITIDGSLNEIEWQQAQTIQDFTTVSPFTLSTPDNTTVAKIFSNETGIYIGISNKQPPETRLNKRRARDDEIEADFNRIFIDFDNSGISAYGFFVGNGGSIRDGIWRNNSTFSTDWDGTWYAQTAEDKEHWYAEVHIPWNVAPMQSTKGSNRTIGLYLGRHHAYLNKDYAIVATEPSRQRFLNDFKSVNVQNHENSSLDIFAYATARKDLVLDNNDLKAGMDIFWKPDADKQLSLALNPDFGQVESDDLVVNFSPEETFLSEKRPFFTENQALFDLQGTRNLRLVHTRRIGGRPDSGPDEIANILAAFKFTANNNNLNYGVFSAIEDNSTNADGRNFHAARIIKKTDTYGLGYLLTRVERPDIDRDATVNTVDFEYNHGEKIQFSGQLLRSDINWKNESLNGNGGWIKLQHQTRENWDQSISHTRFDNTLEVNDFGFLPRNDIKETTYFGRHQFNQFDTQNAIRKQELNYSISYKTNYAGDHLPATISLHWRQDYKDTRFWFWNYVYNSSGVDDLISRGSGSVILDDGHSFFFEYGWGTRNNFRIHAATMLEKHSRNGTGVSVHIHPSYYFSDNYRLEWSAFYQYRKSWLIWQQADQLARFHQQQMTHSIDFDATLVDNQELRIRFQWIPITADAEQAYRISNSGHLYVSDETVSDFSRSITAIQVRYRYELGPLSNFYLVYSRGGYYEEREDQAVGSLFTSGWHDRNADNFIAKIRYRF